MHCKAFRHVAEIPILKPTVKTHRLALRISGEGVELMKF